MTIAAVVAVAFILYNCYKSSKARPLRKVYGEDIYSDLMKKFAWRFLLMSKESKTLKNALSGRQA